MLPGSNTNVRHGGVLFHVQTEDSGRAHPHVITHLYHGGTILASEKSSYADVADAPNLPVRVRELMDAQHHAMLKRLASGELDEQIEQRLGPAVFSAGEKSKTGARTRRALGDSADASDSGTRKSDAGELSEPERTQRPAPGRTSAPRPPAAAPAAPRAGAPDRPLDELILDYLVEAARRRKRRAE
jgi:hypothetical protein